MPIETTLLALTVMDLGILGAGAVFCCVIGWQMRRLATRGREAALQRSLFEAKGAVPQLESALRNRDQRAESLAFEVKAQKARIAELETTARQKELEIGKRDRDIRSLRSELTVLKEGSNGGQVLLDGEFAIDEPDTDPEADKRYKALEARYDALARGLFQRDDRIAELEEQLRNPGHEVPTRTLEQQVSELEQDSSTLQSTLAEREQMLEALQARLQDEVAQREAFEDLARRRGDGNRELKAAAARYEQQIPSLMQTIKARDEQLTERSEKVLTLTRALKDEHEQREAREAEIVDLQKQLAAMESRQRDLQQRSNEQGEARRALETELGNTRETLRATESMVRDRDTALADAGKSITEANEQIAAGERTIATLQHTIEDRNFKIAELEAAAGQQIAKLDMLRSTFFEAKTAHKEQIAELSARNDEHRQALAALTAEHTRLTQEATAHRARIAQLEQQLSLRDEAIAAQEADGRARAAELGAARHELQEALASIACAEVQQRTEAGLRTELESRLAAAVAQHQALEQRLSARETALEERELELRDLQGAACARAVELAQAREATDALARQVDDLSGSLLHSASVLRQRECAITLLVALAGSPLLMLPPPAADSAQPATKRKQPPHRVPSHR